MGGVARTMVAKKKRIWIQPLAVKVLSPSEPLGLQKRVGEIGQQQHGQQQAHGILQAHLFPLLTPGRRRGRRARKERRTRASGPRKRCRPSSSPPLPFTAGQSLTRNA